MLPEWFHQLGLMAWPLACCSIIMLMVCVERIVFLVRAMLKKDKIVHMLTKQLKSYQSQPKILRDEVTATQLQELRSKHDSGIRLLHTIGTISPLLGLLGTILGVISAFKAIAAHTGAVSPSMIADGLWEAMLTTAVGLSIALPAFVMAFIYQSFNEHYLGYLCIRLNKYSIALECENIPANSNKKDREVGNERLVA